MPKLYFEGTRRVHVNQKTYFELEIPAFLTKPEDIAKYAQAYADNSDEVVWKDSDNVPLKYQVNAIEVTKDLYAGEAEKYARPDQRAVALVPPSKAPILRRIFGVVG